VWCGGIHLRWWRSFVPVASVRAGGVDAGGVRAGGISSCWWRSFVLWHSFVLVVFAPVAFMLLLSLQLTYHKALVSNQILCT
jgi:hypothetical protein